MLNLLILPVLISGTFDIGGRVGAVFPVSRIARTVHSGTLLGAQVGYSSGCSRLEVNYNYFDLPGKGAVPYAINFHELALLYSYAVFQRPTWGIALGTGPGLAFITRSFSGLKESGRVADAHITIAIYQQEKNSRVSATIDNIIFIETPAGRAPVFTYFPALTAGVAYAF